MKGLVGTSGPQAPATFGRTLVSGMLQPQFARLQWMVCVAAKTGWATNVLSISSDCDQRLSRQHLCRRTCALASPSLFLTIPAHAIGPRHPTARRTPRHPPHRPRPAPPLPTPHATPHPRAHPDPTAALPSHLTHGGREEASSLALFFSRSDRTRGGLHPHRTPFHPPHPTPRLPTPRRATLPSGGREGGGAPPRAPPSRPTHPSTPPPYPVYS